MFKDGARLHQVLIALTLGWVCCSAKVDSIDTVSSTEYLEYLR